MSQRNWERDPRADDDDSSWSITSVALLVALVVTTVAWVFAVRSFLDDDAAVQRFTSDLGVEDVSTAIDPAGAGVGVAFAVGIVAFAVGSVMFVGWFLKSGVYAFRLSSELLLIVVGAPAVLIALMAMVATEALLMIRYAPHVLGFAARERTVACIVYVVFVGAIVLGSVWMKWLESQMGDPRRRRRR